MPRKLRDRRLETAPVFVIEIFHVPSGTKEEHSGFPSHFKAKDVMAVLLARLGNDYIGKVKCQ